jgi:hypothetical protein
MHSPVEEVGARVGMVLDTMATGALAGTPIGGVLTRRTTLPNLSHLILFSVSPFVSLRPIVFYLP